MCKIGSFDLFGCHIINYIKIIRRLYIPILHVLSTFLVIDKLTCFITLRLTFTTVIYDMI